jgi:thiol-disulfide isomerase/thioredoxin
MSMMNDLDCPACLKAIVLVSVIGCTVTAFGASRLQGPPQKPVPAESERPILVGSVTRADLQKAPFAEWFETQYSRYEPKAADIDQLRGPLQGVSVEAYFGTWCGDSRRQIPRVIKLLDLAGFSEQRLSMVALSDRPMQFKQAPGNPEARRYVHRTPTFVFVRGGVEIGRIVETPVTSIEADLLGILDGEEPTPKYGAEAWVNRLLADLPVAEAEKALLAGGPEVLKRGDPDSLWHYAEQDLLKNGRAREARAVLDLHLKLNPKSVMGYILLSEALTSLGRKAEAIEAIDRALAIEPANGRALRAAEKLRTP